MPSLLPPGPTTGFLGLAAIGEIKRDILGFYERLHRQYGDVVHMRLGPFRDYTFFHPDQIHEVLVAKAKHFIRMPRPIQVLRQWNGDGVLITEGEIWQRHRRILQPAFSPKKLTDYTTAMASATRECFDRLPDGRCEIDVEEVMYDVTTASICRTMFGTDLGGERQELRRAVQVLSGVAVDEMFVPFTWPDWLPTAYKRQKRWAMNLLDSTVRGFLRARKDHSTGGNDLLSMLLTAVDKEGNGSQLTEQQVRDHSVTIFMAGHDTTAAALVWVCWALANSPDVQEKAAQEVRNVLGGKEPSFADLSRLPYLEAVIKETLRRWPPAVAVFGRQATRDVEIGGYRIPRGGIARVFLYITHHDPRWFPEPYKFDPERWLPGRVETIPPLAYLPFGAGPRACIGKDFAMTEMMLAVVLLLQRFRLSHSAINEPALDARMSLRPVGGLSLELSPR